MVLAMPSPEAMGRLPAGAVAFIFLRKLRTEGACWTRAALRARSLFAHWGPLVAVCALVGRGVVGAVTPSKALRRPENVIPVAWW